MKRTLIFFCLVTFIVTSVAAQQTVTIGDVITKNSTVLYLKGNGSQGIIIPIVTNRTNIASPGAEKGMVVFDDSDDALYYHDGSQWVKVGGSTSAGLTLTAGQNITITGTTPNLTISAPNVDAIVGNEVTQVNTRGGIELTGSGTAASPLTVGLIQGTTNGQILKWNSTTSKWELGTDNTGSASVILANGQILTGNGTSNSATTLSGDATLNVGVLTVGTGAITTTKILDKTIGNIDIADNAAIDGAKVTPVFGTQNLSAAAGTFTGNLSIRSLNYTWPAALGAGVLTSNASGVLSWAAASTGTVTSVGLTLPGIFSVTGSPVTTSGTLAATLNSQTAATVFAAPAAAAGVPTFRSLVAGDIPSLDAAKISTGSFPLARISGAGAGTRAILGSDNNTVSWVTGSPNQLLGTDGTGALQFVNKSSVVFTTADVVPKGDGSGLVASNITDVAGNIGIGSTSPTYLLDINKSLASATDTHIRTLNPTAGSGTKSGIRFQTGSGWAVQLQTNQDNSWLELTNNGGTPYHKWTFDSYYPGTTGNVYIQGTATDLALMGGNVGVGTSTPSHKLHIVGGSGTEIRNQISGSNLVESVIGLQAAGTGLSTPNSATYQIIGATGGTYIVGTQIQQLAFRFDGSNAYNMTSTSFDPWGNNTKDLGRSNFRWSNIYLVNNPNVSSDVRLKTDIQNLSYGLKQILELRPVTYRLKEGKEKSVKLGLIAQETQKIIPEIVLADESPEKILGMSYTELVPVLIKAIQEQQAQIDALKQQLKEKDASHSASIEKLAADLEQIKKALGVEASNKK